jgi:hypothetical protein
MAQCNDTARCVCAGLFVHAEGCAKAAWRLLPRNISRGRVPLNRYLVPEWVTVPSAAWVHLLVYLNPHPKELMLRNHL